MQEKENKTISMTKKLFENTELSSFFNNIKINATSFFVNIEFTEQNVSLNEIQRQQVITVLNKIGVQSSAITFMSLDAGNFKISLACIGKEEFYDLLEKNINNLNSKPFLSIAQR